MSEYDNFASDFSKTRQRAWDEFSLFLPYLKKGDRLLDLGCGNGRLRKFLETTILPSGNYFGLDTSQELLKIARENFPKDHFFYGNFAKNLPFGSNNFEIITAIASFHHLLSKKDQLNFLAECKRVLKPNGILFITTWKLPQKHFWSNALKGRFKNWIIPFGKEKLPRTYRKVDDKELKTLMEKAGFKVLKTDLFQDRNYIALGQA